MFVLTAAYTNMQKRMTGHFWELEKEGKNEREREWNNEWEKEPEWERERERENEWMNERGRVCESTGYFTVTLMIHNCTVFLNLDWKIIFTLCLFVFPTKLMGFSFHIKTWY